MLKLIKIPVWTIILALFGLIGSLTAYAYARDTSQIDKNSNKLHEIEKNYATKQEVNQAFIEHYRVHESDEKRFVELIKHIDSKHEDMKDYIDLAIRKNN